MANPAFPFINVNNIITQLPYTEQEEWVVAHAEMENGMSFTRAQHTTRLRRFVVNYPLIQRDEVTVLETFFNSVRGRLGYFTFKDDDGTTWNNCRFDQDDFTPKHAQVNWLSLSLKISVEEN